MIETLGGMHDQAINTINRLSRQLARHTGGEEDLMAKHLFQRLSILLMKGNSSLILSRLPNSTDQQVDGHGLKLSIF